MYSSNDITRQKTPSPYTAARDRRPGAGRGCRRAIPACDRRGQGNSAIRLRYGLASIPLRQRPQDGRQSWQNPPR